MSKLKKALINCVTQAQNVRFKASRLSPRQTPESSGTSPRLIPFCLGGVRPPAKQHHLARSSPMTGFHCGAQRMLDGTMHAIERKGVPCVRYRHAARCHRENGPAAGCSGAKATRGIGVHPPPARAPNLTSLLQPVMLVTGRENRFRVLCRCNILAGRGAGTL